MLTSTKVISAESAIQKIQHHQALVQVLSASVGNDHAWERLLIQIANPQSVRPVRSLDETLLDRNRVYNPKTGVWHHRSLSNPRGDFKNTIHTKKRCLSLLPKDGKMHLYKPFNASDTVGILFDLDSCHLKDGKYIFTKDAATNSRFWIKSKSVVEQHHKVARSTSLNELSVEIEAIRNRGEIPEYNEILAGVSLDSVTAVFATRNTAFDRLNALLKKNYILEKLNIDLPVLIITPGEGIIIYDEAMQQNDLQKGLVSSNAREKLLAKRIIEGLKSLTIKPSKKSVGVEEYLRNKAVSNLNLKGYEYVRESNGNEFYSNTKGDRIYSNSNGTHYRKQLYRENVYIYSYTDQLEDILEANVIKTTDIIFKSGAEIDYVISGVLELNSLCHKNGVTLKWNKQQIQSALNVLVQALSKIDYQPIYLNSDFFSQITFRIEEYKLAGINTLEELISFTERNHLKLDAFHRFQAILKSLLMNHIRFSHLSFEVFVKAFSFLQDKNDIYSQRLLSYFIENDKHNWQEHVLYLLSKGVKLDPKVFDNLPLPQAIAKYENYFYHIDLMLTRCENPESKILILKFKEALIFGQHKRLFIEFLVTSIREQSAIKPFKTFYFGGKEIDGMKLPDGIARIIELSQNRKHSVSTKYDLIKSILSEKVKSISGSGFFRVKRDPELVKFYKDFHTSMCMYESGQAQLLQFGNVCHTAENTVGKEKYFSL